MTDDTPTANQYGIGPTGSRIAAAAHRTGFDFVSAIDIDSEKAGRDLGTSFTRSA